MRASSTRSMLATWDPSRSGATCAANGLRPNRRFSQNFLADGAVLEAIVAAAAIDAPVPPVANALGRARRAPGPRDRARHRHPDRRPARPPAPTSWPSRSIRAWSTTCADASPTPSPTRRLRLVHDDILERAVGDLVAPPWDLVANLPYHITSPILHHVLGRRAAARALRADAPARGRRAHRRAAGRHELPLGLRPVPRRRLDPAGRPGVGLRAGAGGRLRRAGRSDAGPAPRCRRARRTLWRLVQAGFRERRKMLHNVLPRQLPWLGRERIEAALAACDIAPDRRPQTLSVEAWLALAAALGPLDARRRPPPRRPAVMIATRARAKVNLALAVVGRRAGRLPRARLGLRPPRPGRRADGRARRATAGSARAGRRLDRRTGPTADDLVLRAAAPPARRRGRRGASGLTFRLTKHVPLAAGLGGGSADAAAALDLAARAWGSTLTDDERRALAARLGSDVPFFAADVDAALVTGRGEHVEPLPGPLDAGRRPARDQRLRGSRPRRLRGLDGARRPQPAAPHDARGRGARRT